MRRRLLIAAVLMLSALILAPSPAIAKTKTKISVSMSSSLEHADYTPTITGQLKTSKGKAITGTRVYLYRDGTRYASAKTNSKGRASFSAPTAADSYTAAWTIRFNGSSKYKPSTSPTTQTTVHVHYDAAVSYLGIDSGGNHCFKENLGLEAGRGYWMEFSHPMVVVIAHPGGGVGGGVWAGSGGLPVTEFDFGSVPPYQLYDLFLYTNAAWGGDDTADAFVW